MNIRYPNITGQTPDEQIRQLKSYLYQLVEELNLQESSGGAPSSVAGGNAPYTGEPSGGAAEPETTPVSTFNQVKNLIIKSADIIDAYYTEISRRLEGHYVAESDFGKYKSTTAQSIQENADEITRSFDRIDEISGKMEQVIKANAYVRQGLLFTVSDEGTLEEELEQNLAAGTPVYGVEVGQTVTQNGAEIFRKFARFTAYGMTLYDNNGNLSAFITDHRLNIPNAVVKNSLRRGGFVETINADGSSVERWVGV